MNGHEARRRRQGMHSIGRGAFRSASKAYREVGWSGRKGKCRHEERQRGWKTPAPEDQGFLINASRIRVSGGLRGRRCRGGGPRGGTGQHSRTGVCCEAGTEDRNRRPQTELRVEARRYTARGDTRGAESRQYGEASADPTARGRRLPRKAAKLQAHGARTGNRHRWSRRVSKGARVSHS